MFLVPKQLRGARGDRSNACEVSSTNVKYLNYKFIFKNLLFFINLFLRICLVVEFWLKFQDISFLKKVMLNIIIKLIICLIDALCNPNLTF